ncbi:MAG: hypothetical protein GWP59_01885 [Chlamydiales bacterium]|nr:hypothetical protein [Chlamydiales bacterium]
MFLEAVFIQEIFNRLFGFVCFFAFASLYYQFDGLFSKDGLSSIEQNLNNLKLYFKKKSKSKSDYYLKVAYTAFSIFFIYYSDNFSKKLLLLGSVLSLSLLIFNFLAPLCLFLLLVIFLSFTNLDFDFLSFQWDTLLTEMLFFAIFYNLCPEALLSTYQFLWSLILFKLMFLSGIVKIKSKDENWRKLKALNFHYYTQPLPNKLAYYLYNMPQSFHKFCCAIMFVIEIIVPFLIFIPSISNYAIALLILLQVLIFLSGNFSFFNVQSIVLCIPSITQVAIHPQAPALGAEALLFFCWVLFFSCLHIGVVLQHFITLPDSYQKIISFFKQLKLLNAYGLFAVMTTKRREIIVQGSYDNKKWQTLEFKYKPSLESDNLKQITPFHPRLDWQMWFAALGNYQENPWLTKMLFKILNGSEALNSLLHKNPFSKEPPKYVRCLLAEYTFTKLEDKPNCYWESKPLGLYCPVFSKEGPI